MSASQWRIDLAQNISTHDAAAAIVLVGSPAFGMADAYFDVDAVNHAGNTEKATRYLRMALNTHNTELLNKFDIKSLGDTNNA